MVDLPALHLSPAASEDEAAAITAAMERLLAEEARAGRRATTDEDPWRARRYAFAGRLASLTGEAARLPRRAPGDPWTALGRVERLRGADRHPPSPRDR